MVNLNDDPLHQRNTQWGHKRAEELASQTTFHDIAEQVLAAYDNAPPTRRRCRS
jgi:hypothetical protein